MLALPPAGNSDAVLTFEVMGEVGVSGFFTPVVRPIESSIRERPPNLVVFVADTLRADALGAPASMGMSRPQRSQESLTPFLDQFAAGSLSFTQARSVATWTLPAHASMFTGLFPLQHGAIQSGNVLADEFVTLAEHLQTAGYRTIAITDAAFVSRYFGLDQGFELFVERSIAEWDMRATVERALDQLDNDDGRPTFLFVHTYRVHEPYRIGVEESDQQLRDLMSRVRSRIRGSGWKKGDDVMEALGPLVAELRSLYYEGVHGFDTVWGEWVRSLEQRSFFQDGFLVLTSDHGEAFFEHGKRSHGGKPYDEEARIPLLIRGPNVQPRRATYDVSNLDLPRTVAALADIAPHTSWGGASALTERGELPTLSHSKGRAGEFLALVLDGHKAFTRDSAGEFPLDRVAESYNLATDPLEQEDLGAGDSTATALLDRFAPALRPWVNPLVEAEVLEFSDEFNDAMGGIGYTASK